MLAHEGGEIFDREEIIGWLLMPGRRPAQTE